MSSQVPEQDKQVIDVSRSCYDEIRAALVAAGTAGGTIIERGTMGRVIDMGGVVVRTGVKDVWDGVIRCAENDPGFVWICARCHSRDARLL